MQQESLGAVVTRSAETWQFFAFIFAALLAASFGFIDEVAKRWPRVALKLVALIGIGYFTLFSTWGRNFLAGILGVFKTETLILQGASQTNFNWDVGQVSTGIIALCALGLTIWQAMLTRRHNRLSVKPYLTIWNDLDQEKHRYWIQLLNNGTGPALIKDFRIEIHGERVNAARFS
jgi:hypothetical protein